MLKELVVARVARENTVGVVVGLKIIEMKEVIDAPTAAPDLKEKMIRN